jgi:Na+/melibiose symporter-like transporter
MLGTFLFLTYFLQGTLGYSALKTGFAFLPFSAGIIIGAGSASRILPRTGPRTLIVTGLAMATAGLLWFSRLQPHSTYAAARAHARSRGQHWHGLGLRAHELNLALRR